MSWRHGMGRGAMPAVQGFVMPRRLAACGDAPLGSRPVAPTRRSPPQVTSNARTLTAERLNHAAQNE